MPPNPSLIAGLAAFVDELAPEIEPSSVGDVEGTTIAEAVLSWAWQFQRLLKNPMIDHGLIVESVTAGRLQLLVPSPVKAHGLMARLIDLILRFQRLDDANEVLTGLRSALPKLVGGLRALAPTGSNIPHLLAAAKDLGVPVQPVQGQIFQFGYGSKSRRLESTFTDATPHVSAMLARDKQSTASVLRDGGLPVVRHAVAKSVEQASKVAEQLGYPVVVKPADLDGGVAVAAGLTNADEVARAFAEAKKHSRKILVEKHVAGRDYRLTVFNDEMLWAIERIPAGVTGDGRNSIRALLDVANADERRGEGIHAKLKKIALDDEALGLLASLGKTPDSVLHRGEFVPLRRRANVAAGGTPVAVTDLVHPDNRRLAVRAAQALGLDIAGIDLLIPDIGRSWMEGGAAICEVNGQPQLGSVTSRHLYPYILQNLLEGDGRIPISLVIGAPDLRAAAQERERYAAMGLTIGYHDSTGVYVGGERVAPAGVGLYQVGRALLRDRAVDGLVMDMKNFECLRSGFPFDRCERLIVAGDNIDWPSGLAPAYRGRLLDGLIASIPSATDVQRNSSQTERT